VDQNLVVPDTLDTEEIRTCAVLLLGVVTSQVKMKLVRSPQRFLLTPAPGWSEIAHDEVKNILCSPWGAAASYPSRPSLEMKANQHLLLSQCNYSQAVEISMRALSLHDIDWIIHERRCSNPFELQKQLSQLPFDQILSMNNKASADPAQGSAYKLICYANRSFLNSSSGLKEIFTKSVMPGIGAISSERTAENSSKVPENRIKIFLLENVLSVFISFGGHDLPLFKRGYKFQLDPPSSSLVAEVPSTVATDSGKPTSPISAPAVAPLAEHHAAAAFLWMLSLKSPSAELHKSSESIDDTPLSQTHALMKNIDQIIVPFAGTGQ
jgi:hypothetical protein